METLLIVTTIVFGLVLGSFFNVVIWRLPRGESVVLPSSHCPACGRSIKPLENIPILSYLVLRGRCRGCGSTISVRYVLVELLTAGCAALIWFQMIEPALDDGVTVWEGLRLGLTAITLLALIPVTVIDLQHYIIPDAITLPGLALGLVLSLAPGAPTPLQSALGVLAGGGSLLLFGKLGEIVFRKGEAMGGGDIKLMALVGAVWGWQVAVEGIVFGSVLGAAIGITLSVAHLLPEDHRIPFGPFLAVGVWIAVFAGEEIVTWYLAFTESLLM
jgi:leader peptidase (prepilin peptidase)/N-methyltransferase